MRRIQIDLLIEYWCGCKIPTRTTLEIPDELITSERTPESDRAITDYIEREYDMERTVCPNKKHRATTYKAFRRIVEILS